MTIVDCYLDTESRESDTKRAKAPGATRQTASTAACTARPGQWGHPPLSASLARGGTFSCLSRRFAFFAIQTLRAPFAIQTAARPRSSLNRAPRLHGGAGRPVGSLSRAERRLAMVGSGPSRNMKLPLAGQGPFALTAPPPCDNLRHCQLRQLGAPDAAALTARALSPAPAGAPGSCRPCVPQPHSQAISKCDSAGPLGRCHARGPALLAWRTRQFAGSRPGAGDHSAEGSKT
jgi:hypothetical protein